MKTLHNLPTVTIADNSKIIFKGLQESLRKNFNVLEPIVDQDNLLIEIAKIKSDILMINTNMPYFDLNKTSNTIVSNHCPSRIVLYNQTFCNAYVHSVELGMFHGYVLSNTPPRNLTSALSDILSGNSFITPEAYTRYKRYGNEPVAHYSSKKFVVFYYTIHGFTVSEIAALTFTSTSNVYKHQEDIYLDTNTRSIQQLIYYALINEFMPSTEITDKVRKSFKLNKFGES